MHYEVPRTCARGSNGDGSSDGGGWGGGACILEVLKGCEGLQCATAYTNNGLCFDGFLWAKYCVRGFRECET